MDDAFNTEDIEDLGEVLQHGQVSNDINKGLKGIGEIRRDIEYYINARKTIKESDKYMQAPRNPIGWLNNDQYQIACNILERKGFERDNIVASSIIRERETDSGTEPAFTIAMEQLFYLYRNDVDVTYPEHPVEYEARISKLMGEEE